MSKRNKRPGLAETDPSTEDGPTGVALPDDAPSQELEPAEADPDEGEPPFETAGEERAADDAGEPEVDVSALPAASPVVAAVDHGTAREVRARLEEIDRQLAELGDPAGRMREAQTRWREYDAEMRDTMRTMTGRANDLKAKAMAAVEKLQGAAWKQGQLERERETLRKAIGA